MNFISSRIQRATYMYGLFFALCFLNITYKSCRQCCYCNCEFNTLQFRQFIMKPFHKFCWINSFCVDCFKFSCDFQRWFFEGNSPFIVSRNILLTICFIITQNKTQLRKPWEVLEQTSHCSSKQSLNEFKTKIIIPKIIFFTP